MSLYCDNCLNVMSETVVKDQTDLELLQIKIQSHPHLVSFFEDFSDVEGTVEYFYCIACTSKYKATTSMTEDDMLFSFDELLKTSKKNRDLITEKLSSYLYLHNQYEKLQQQLDSKSTEQVTLYRLIGANKLAVLDGQSNLELLQLHGYNSKIESPSMTNVHFSLENLVEQESFSESVADSLYIATFKVPMESITLQMQMSLMYPYIEVLSEHPIPPEDISLLTNLNGENHVKLIDFDVNNQPKKRSFYQSFQNLKETIKLSRETDKHIDEIKRTIEYR